MDGKVTSKIFLIEEGLARVGYAYQDPIQVLLKQFQEIERKQKETNIWEKRDM